MLPVRLKQTVIIFYQQIDRLLKYKTEVIELLDPIDFIKKWEVEKDE